MLGGVGGRTGSESKEYGRAGTPERYGDSEMRVAVRLLQVKPEGDMDCTRRNSGRHQEAGQLHVHALPVLVFHNFR